MIHIGSLIEQELRRQDRSVTWFASELHFDRTNVYKVFKKKSIDTLLLENICVILRHNFFLDYAEDIVCPNWLHAIVGHIKNYSYLCAIKI